MCCVLQTSVDVAINGVVTLRVAGEIDRAVAPDLAAAIDKACAAGPPKLIIDLAGVTFCGAAGIDQFVQAAHVRACEGTTLRITHVAPNVRRVFHVCDVDHLLEP